MIAARFLQPYWPASGDDFLPSVRNEFWERSLGGMLVLGREEGLDDSLVERKFNFPRFVL